MKAPQRILYWCAAISIVFLIWNFRPQGNLPAGSDRLAPVPKNHRRPEARRSQAAATDPAILEQDAAITRLIERSLAELSTSSSPEESDQILKKLRDGIHETSHHESAAAAIIAFLNTKQDVATGLPFSVGPEGMMTDTPTLRTALLDLLPSLDPLAALDSARSVMDHTQSPDEFALALRNLAWNDSNGDLLSELNTRLNQMLSMKPWCENPSAGFLEALDAAVKIESQASFDAIARLGAEALAAEDSSLGRAAVMVLDRMILRNPSLLVTAFEVNPGWLSASPEQRATLMSRLDVTDPAQRDAFSRYLTATPHGSGEMEYFAKLFPNGNYLHGNWLITSSEATHSISTRLVEDRKVLAEIERMIAGYAGDAGAETLVRIKDRLKQVIEEGRDLSPNTND
jgi:hypothetical protein